MTFMFSNVFGVWIVSKKFSSQPAGYDAHNVLQKVCRFLASLAV